VRQILASINDAHSTRWELMGKLTGGYQQGAYELRDGSGGRAVLKWHAGHLPAKQLRETARALEQARARGWPTSKWLAYGALPNDGAYIVEEFIAGERPSRLERRVLERLLDALDVQAGARPVTDQDWSSYIYRCVFEGEADLARRMRARPETAALLRRLEAITAAGRAVRLPSEDLVHGDFVLNNMIVRGSQPYLLDAAHAGKGTRAYDLATLLMETTVGGEYVAPSLEMQHQLERECVAIVGRLGFLVCVACRIMHLLVFGGVNWSDEVPGAVSKCDAFLDGLDATRTG
jgi:aminoglycoside phosphotransferase (APT) family kinase protein